MHNSGISDWWGMWAKINKSTYNMDTEEEHSISFCGLGDYVYIHKFF
jgi:hypothetical protein